MRSYLILKEKVKQFAEDKEIQALLAEINAAQDEPLTYKSVRPDQLLRPISIAKPGAPRGTPTSASTSSSLTFCSV